MSIFSYSIYQHSKFTGIKILATILSLSIFSLSFAEQIEIPQAQNLQALGKLQQASGRVILLYISAPDCPYCIRLEKEIIRPLIKSGAYTDKVILRQLVWRSSSPIINFAGEEQIPADFLLDYEIIAAPTLLFLGGDGRELTKKITGYQGDDFFWYYLDSAIEKSIH